MQTWNKDYSYFKFFPAETTGSITFVQTLASPLSEIRFCPTGGITKNTVQWLSFLTSFALGVLG
ncbi:hypothetical protein [Bartonella alsatica]|nr:hypothetical protein [Bartonella alsatica]